MRQETPRPKKDVAQKHVVTPDVQPKATTPKARRIALEKFARDWRRGVGKRQLQS